MKPLYFGAAIIAIAVLVSVSPAQQRSSEQNTPTGKAFLTKVAQINLAEIKLGKLAKQKGNNQAVKDFGERMIEDHTQAQLQLQRLAKEKGVNLPSDVGSPATTLDEQLSALSGTRFDEMYVQHMLEGHKGAIALLENEIEHGRDPAIKAYAEQVLPTIQDHIRLAENVAGKMDLPGRQGLTQPDKAITAAASPK